MLALPAEALTSAASWTPWTLSLRCTSSLVLYISTPDWLPMHASPDPLHGKSECRVENSACNLFQAHLAPATDRPCCTSSAALRCIISQAAAGQVCDVRVLACSGIVSIACQVRAPVTPSFSASLQGGSSDGSSVLATRRRSPTTVLRDSQTAGQEARTFGAGSQKRQRIRTQRGRQLQPMGR